VDALTQSSKKQPENIIATECIGNARLIHADCFVWLRALGDLSLHSIVTDPPYGLVEYDPSQLEKRKNGNGGIWRIPPSFDGHTRSPLPRFTALNGREKHRLTEFFAEWAIAVSRVLRPGGHVLIATSSVMAILLYSALANGGLEFRGQIIRLVRTLRGGDRPKNAENDFPGVSSLPRGCYEPWGVFRKPLPPKMTVGDCLREYQTGGLRRKPNGTPFEDVIESERTPSRERAIADHPSLKPQSLLRQLVYMSLPLGTGTIADPFMGSGSTIAAAESVGYSSIGVEKQLEYFTMAVKAVPQLAILGIHGKSSWIPSSHTQLDLRLQ